MDVSWKDLDGDLGNEDAVLPMFSQTENRFSSSLLGILSELPRRERHEALRKILDLDATVEILSVLCIVSQWPDRHRTNTDTCPDGRILLLIRHTPGDGQGAGRLRLRIVALEAKMWSGFDQDQLEGHRGVLRAAESTLSEEAEKAIKDNLGDSVPSDIEDTELQLLKVSRAKSTESTREDGILERSISWRDFTDALEEVATNLPDGDHLQWLTARVCQKMRSCLGFYSADDKFTKKNMEGMLEAVIREALKKLSREGQPAREDLRSPNSLEGPEPKRRWTCWGTDFFGGSSDGYQWQFLGLVDTTKTLGRELFEASPEGEPPWRLLATIIVRPGDKPAGLLELRNAIREEVKDRFGSKAQVRCREEGVEEKTIHASWRLVRWYMAVEDLTGKTFSEVERQLIDISNDFWKIRQAAIKSAKWNPSG